MPGSVPREFINGTTYSTASLISMSRISVGNSFAINTLIKKKHQFEILGIPTKGLKTANHNADYYRGLNLATKQISSGKTILSKYLTYEQLIIKRGIIILCFIENEQFNMEIHVVEL